MKIILSSLAITCALALFCSPASAETVTYKDGNIELEGYWSASTCGNENAPLVMIVHQWKGLTEYEKSRADMLAAKCYNAFAVDMYGKGVRPKNLEEAGKQATIYKNDSPLARRRITAALDYGRERPGTDASKIAVIGYCFGGTMALELARSGADIDAAIAFHAGLTSKAPQIEPGIIKASVQVHHGPDDPYVPHEEVHNFMEEMNKADADWSLIHYAHAVHSFTEKEAGSDPSKGAAYNEKADKRSWQAALSFLEERLGSGT